MEGLLASLLVIALGLAAPASAREAVLRPHGASAPLSLLSGLARRAGLPAPLPPTPEVRQVHVNMQLQTTPHTLQQASAPAYALPRAPASPALPHVATDGTPINADGIAAGSGAPNVDGAVGEHQYVQLAGGRIAVYQKQSGALQLAPVGLHTLFSGAALDACGTPQGGTGSVLYDHQARRWIIARLAGKVQCIAVSTTPDATGSYRRYGLALEGPARAPLYADDARMALWNDALYFTFSTFDRAQGSYRGPRICAIARMALLRGRDAALRCADPGSHFGPAVVATLEGNATAPTGSAALILSLGLADDDNGQRLVLWRWASTSARIGAPLAIPVAPFRPACGGQSGQACVRQPHPGGALDASGERLMPRVAYRANTLVLMHAVQADGGQTGLRWYELRDVLGAAYVYQQGTHAPDLDHRATGSIGIDKAGNIALGYSVAGADTPPGIRYTGRVRSDAPGRLAGEETLVNGTGVQTGDAPRWPVSGALALDPADDCTFWYTQHYVPVTGQNTWRTRIASFKFRNCM